MRRRKAMRLRHDSAKRVTEWRRTRWDRFVVGARPGLLKVRPSPADRVRHDRVRRRRSAFRHSGLAHPRRINHRRAAKEILAELNCEAVPFRTWQGVPRVRLQLQLLHPGSRPAVAIPPSVQRPRAHGADGFLSAASIRPLRLINRYESTGRGIHPTSRRLLPGSDRGDQLSGAPGVLHLHAGRSTVPLQKHRLRPGTGT